MKKYNLFQAHKDWYSANTQESAKSSKIKILALHVKTVLIKTPLPWFKEILRVSTTLNSKAFFGKEEKTEAA